MKTDLFNSNLMEAFDVEEGSLASPVNMVITPPEGKNKEKEEPVEDPDLIDIEESIEGEDAKEKETDEKPEGKGTNKQAPSDDKGQSSLQIYKTFAKALNEEGVLAEFDEESFDNLVEEHGSAVSALLHLAEKTVTGAIESFKEEAQEEFRLFLAARDAGVNLDEYAKVSSRKNVVNSIKPEALDDDEELQERVVLTDLLSKGETEEDAKGIVEALKDTGKLLAKSKTALTTLKKRNEAEEKALFEKAKMEDEAKARQLEEQRSKFKQMVDNVTEIVPGVQLTTKLKKEIYEAVTQPVKTLEDGTKINLVTAKRLEDPLKYAMIEAYLVKTGAFDGKFDAPAKAQKTKALKELEEKLNNTTEFKSGDGGTHKSGRGNSEKLGYLWEPKTGMK